MNFWIFYIYIFLFKIQITKLFFFFRTGTMVCATISQLISISREGYDKVIGAYEKLIIDEKIEFLKQFSFFEKIPNSNILSLILYAKIKKFEKKAVIYDEGMKPN